MLQKIIILMIVVISSFAGLSQTMAAKHQGEITGYTTLTTVDLGTFNEYRYRLTEQFFRLREKFNVDRIIDTVILGKIETLSKEGYNYLPDNLKNKNFLVNLRTEIKKGIKYPNSESNYGSIVKALQSYIENVVIEKVKGRIDAFPKEGNAPLTVTLRGVITDPTGTKIPDTNYVWWIDNGGKRKIIGHRTSINYTLKEEGNFSIFLDVKSNHKNVKGYTDVISFRSRANIKVKAKIASVIIKVNSSRLDQVDNIKFSPEEAKYGLLFDATSSTPTSGSKFVETTWDFGNGITRKYSGNPKIERIIYTREGDFTVKLKLKTNELKTVERKFTVMIHNPIATIYSSKKDGYLGDKFTFSTKTNSSLDNLTYSWEIVDLNNDKVVLKKSDSILTYLFNKKGRYSIKLKATDIGGNIDIDTKIITINSRPPVAKFKYKISAKNTPNKIFFDATNSFDPDFTDDGKLEYSWTIDGNRVNLDNPNNNGSIGYYSFDSIGEHSVVLEVTDPDKITSQKKLKVKINSILSVDFEGLPRVITRKGKIDFVGISPEALFYEWTFGDNKKQGGAYDKISHTYNESGIFNVTLTVRDKDDNKNSITKSVYVGESDRPYAFIGFKNNGRQDLPFIENACGNKGAYITDKVTTLNLSGNESINITGKNTGLTYSWKIGSSKYYSSVNVSHRFDELGCYPIKLTVKSKNNNKTNSITKWVKIENVLPTLSSIEVNVKNIDSDPVIVDVKALGAKDKDGVIQSYLWYYYTDIDSEPQDFRSTIGPSTSFVLPKVTGNYYFVVVMKDNNEAIISSEEINKSKYFITLTGDNINTPLINLSVNDSSASVGQDVVFSANVKNILGRNLKEGVKYSWDFDGDGFYDKETTKSNITYRYKYSGKFYVKVKVKYKGFSNTKSITLNVVNKLIPQFDFISFGNKYIFFNLSKGNITSSTWDFGNGHITKKDNSFVYTYTDKKPSHIVKLKIAEGTKVKTIEKKVVKDVKNLLKSRKKGIKVFSYPEINSDNKILVQNIGDSVFVYMGESTGNIKYYAIDYDISYDSDLNGGKDDDEDNKNTISYTSGIPVEIKLNKNKLQKLRFVTKDENSEVIDSYDFEIVKNYIEEKNISLNEITFKGISTSEKIKIEKLKSIISNIEQKNRLKSMMYLQKLQDGWFDNTEKTRVILEFESFVDNIKTSRADEIIGILESLLVEGQSDKSEKSISFNALKNLVPSDIDCKYTSKEYKTCKEYIVGELGNIKNSSDIIQNKKTGSIILEILLSNAKDKGESWMSSKNLLDFKAIIKTLIYGGVSSIPNTEKNQITAEQITVDNSSSGGLLTTILYSLLSIIGIISLLIFGYWIYYKISNKNSDETFEGFIKNKTSNKFDNENNDILSSLDSSEDEKEGSVPVNSEIGVKEKIEEQNSDIFSIQEIKEEKINPGVEKKEEKKDDISSLEEDKRTIEKEKTIDVKEKFVDVKENSKEELDNITKIEEDNIPSWLKASLETSKEEKINPGVEKKEEEKEEKKDDIFSLEEDKKNIEKEKTIDVNEKPVEVEENSKEELDNITKIEEDNIPDKEEDNIPDWLKGSINDGEKKKIEKKEIKESISSTKKLNKEKVDNKKTKVSVKKEKQEQKNTSNTNPGIEKEAEKKEIIESKKPIKKKVSVKKEIIEEDKKDKKERPMVIPDEVEKEIKEKTKEVKGLNFSEITKQSDDLWDDGMKIPGWLQTGEEKLDEVKKEKKLSLKLDKSNNDNQK